MFRGCSFYLQGSFQGEETPSKKDIEGLIKAGDGVVLQREPNPESLENTTVPFHVTDAENPLWTCSHYVIYQEGPYEPQLKYDMVHIKSLPLSWLLNCANHFSLLNPKKGLSS